MSDEIRSPGHDGTPRVFGNYEIVTDDAGAPVMLGEGTFGRTFLARHPVLGKHAAIKVIGDAHLHSKRARDGFLGEARNAAQLEHPNIARVLDSGDAAGTLYYVMDYCAGGDMQHICERHGALPVEWLYELMRQMLEALNHAHKQGYVHRDIKPSNIMIASRDYPPVFKLIDFGLTKSLVGEQAAMSMDSRFKGTLMFASPEQLREEAVDARSDLFALGMTAWYLAVGKPPVDDRMAAIVAERLSAADYQQALPARLPAAMRTFLGRLLRKDPKQRLQSASDALELLASGIGSQLRLSAKAEDWQLDRARPADVGVAEAGVAADAAEDVPREAPPVEQFEGSFRRRYGDGVLEETDADADMLVGVVPHDAASGGRVRLMISLLSGKDDATKLAELARKWAMLPFAAVGRMLRIEVFADAVALVFPHHGPGLDMLTVLRARGLMRMRDVAVLLESIARVADAAHDKGLVGVDPAPHRIFLEFSPKDGRTPAATVEVPEGPMLQWPPFEVRLMPWFLSAHGAREGSASGGHSTLVAGAGDWQKNMTQGFSVLVYRLLSGRMPPAAALLSLEGYVPVTELNEPGNRALAAALADRGNFPTCAALLAALQGAEGAVMSAAPSVMVRSTPSVSAERSSMASRRVLATAVNLSHSVGAEIQKGKEVAAARERRKFVLLAGIGVAAALVAGALISWKMFAGKESAPQDVAGGTATAGAPTNPGGGTTQQASATNPSPGGSTPAPPASVASTPPSEYVIRGGIEPALVSVTLNGSLADNIRTVGVDGVAIPIRPGTAFPLRMVFEAQGYERHELELNAGDHFERGDRLVMRRSSGVVEVAGGDRSGYELLQFSMLRPLDGESDVARTSVPVQLDLKQRTTLDLPTGVYRVIARAPNSRQISNVELPGELVLKRGAREALNLAPGLSGTWQSMVPEGILKDLDADLFVWRIPDGYSEGSLSARTSGGMVDLAILDGMKYRMFEGLSGVIEPTADGAAYLSTLRFSAKTAETGGARMNLNRDAGGDPIQLELTPMQEAQP